MASMLETVPPLLETVIYGYFLVIAAIGCYLHARYWVATRNRSDQTDETGA